MAETGKLSLLIGGDYDRTRAIRDGRVRPEGCALQLTIREPTHVVFNTLCQTDEYDGGELSLSFYSTLLSRHGPNLRFVGLPVYTSRMFRHGNILVNTRSGITSPKDLEGRKCGVPEYGMTMAVWVRGLLRNEFGVDTDTMSWFTGREPVALRPDELRYPDHIRIQRGSEQKRLVEDLSAGVLDAYIGPVPRVLPPNVRRLFPDYGTVERDYYRRTGVYPIQHVLVLRREAWERNRASIDAVYAAFRKAKDMALEDLSNSAVLRVSLPWLLPALEEQSAIFGGDPWPYGLEHNRTTITTYLSYAYEQGLLWRQLTADEMFVPVQEG